MHTPEGLLDLHARAHQNLVALMAHCRSFDADELHRELAGFGYPTVQLQLHHEVVAERYWVGVLHGRIDAEEDAGEFPTVESLEHLREQVFQATETYLQAASIEELNSARPMMTWGRKEERLLTPANIILRTQMHLYHHQGQLLAMCRLLGKPANGFDYPIT